MIAASIIWDPANIFRLVVATGGAFLVFTNIAFFTHAPTIFPAGATTIWRLFFIGKSMITASASYAVWRGAVADKPISAISILAVIGIACTNVSLWLLYRYNAKTVVIIPREESHARQEDEVDQEA